MQSAARFFTVSVDTSLQLRTIGVRSASDGNVHSSAGSVGGSLESGRTLADGGVIERLALLILGAGVRQRARVGAQAVDAGLVGRTVVQVGASDRLATELRVSFRSRRALADGSVLDADADRSTFADERIADGLALAVDAGVRSRAFLVRLTAGLVTGDERIAGESFLAGADRFALNDATDGVGAAVAGTLADAVTARLVRRALGVRFAADDGLRGLPGHGGDAATVAVHEAVRRALTDDRAKRSAVDHAAKLSGVAARLHAARIRAFVVDADFLARAVRIGSALRSKRTSGGDGRVFDAPYERVASRSGRTFADGLMLPSGTAGSRGAGDRLADFDADAVEPVAHLVRVAVVVALAADRYANDGGVALHSGRAVALRSVECYAAESVCTALVAAEHARVQTLAGDAGSVGRTVVVAFTFRCNNEAQIETTLMKKLVKATYV